MAYLHGLEIGGFVGTTWNPSDKHTNITLTDSDLTATAGSGHGAVRSVLPISGKFVVSCTVGTIPAFAWGFGTLPAAGNLTLNYGLNGTAQGQLNIQNGGGTPNRYNLRTSPSGTTSLMYAGTSTVPEVTVGDVISLIIDVPDQKYWIAVNGTLVHINSTDAPNPSTGTSSLPDNTLLSTDDHIFFTGSSASCTANFGENQPYSWSGFTNGLLVEDTSLGLYATADDLGSPWFHLTEDV